MPSLTQLEEFKSSFRTIGGENQQPMEDFELPETEPQTPFPEEFDRSAGPDSEPSFLDVNDLGLDLPAESFSGIPDAAAEEEPAFPDFPDSPDSDDGFDFGDLLSDMPEPLAETAELTEPAELAEPAAESLPESQDIGSLSEDISSLDEAPEIPEETPKIPEEAPEIPEEEAPPETDFADMEFPDFDLSQAVDMGGESRDDIPTEQLSADSNLTDELSFDSNMDTEPEPEPIRLDEELSVSGSDFDMELPAIDDFGTDTEPELVSEDIGTEDFGIEGFETDSIESGDLETDSLESGESIDLINETEPEAEDFGIDQTLPDLDSGSFEDTFETESLAVEDAGISEDDFNEIPVTNETQESTDPFDNFAVGDDWKASETVLDTPDFSEASADEFGDFSLPGFDEDSAKPGKAPEKFIPSESDDIEEIKLNENEYKKLQETLSAYPLNLRIACEELIAEQAVAPDQMSALIKLLTRGAPAKETASLASKILGKPISIPKGYAKKTGMDLEAEQASFAYIFIHRFLPILRLAGIILLLAVSVAYLSWRFIVIPIQADRIYKDGYSLIQTGEYVQANERFRQAFARRPVKKWFYRYAEAFRDERQFLFAQRMYDELLRIYPRDKKGALDYAAMETNILRNYEKADRIIRNNILDYSVNDREGLLALGENNLAWGEIDYSRYEEARAAFARLLDRYGRNDLFLEGMLRYFIRTDNLAEVLPLQAHFMSSNRRRITVPTLAELGGYLLDKKFAETEGVPEEFADQIEGTRDILIRAIRADRSYPESYYHLARYHRFYNIAREERQSLMDAIRVFAAAPEESPRRAAYQIDAHRRYAEVLINAREFFPAEEVLIRGISLYEDARSRQVIRTSNPEFGLLYAHMGDLEFYVKAGDMEAALRFYHEAERNGWAPPEIQYRMGAAHYHMEQWEEALERFVFLTSLMPNNKRLLYALGNTSYLRGNYFAAQAYYNRLLNVMEAERIYFPNLVPGGRREAQEFLERIMVAENNLGVTLEALTRITGDISYRTRALYLFSESIRAWDILTRDPETLSRMRPVDDLYGPGINLPYLNTQNILHPAPTYDQQIFMRIDRDGVEPSPWDYLIGRDYQLMDQLLSMERELVR